MSRNGHTRGSTQVVGDGKQVEGELRGHAGREVGEPRTVSGETGRQDSAIDVEGGLGVVGVDADAAGLEDKRLAVRGPEEIGGRGRAGVATGAPPSAGCAPRGGYGERVGVRGQAHIGTCRQRHVVRQTVEGLNDLARGDFESGDRRVLNPGNGDGVGRHAAGGAGVWGKQCIGHGRERLAGAQRGERAWAVGPHVNLQPEGAAAEGGSKVQGDEERTVLDWHRVRGERRGLLRASGLGIPEGEGEVIIAAGRVTAGGKCALISEDRALGEGGELKG